MTYILKYLGGQYADIHNSFEMYQKNEMDWWWAYEYFPEISISLNINFFQMFLIKCWGKVISFEILTLFIWALSFKESI